VYIDKITEEVAHFIGLFHTSIEQGRLRYDYLEFKAQQKAAEEQLQEQPDPLDFKSPYPLADPDPGLHYVPAVPKIEQFSVTGSVHFAPLKLAPEYSDIYPAYLRPSQLQVQSSGGHTVITPEPVGHEISPPGQLASLVTQTNMLSDNDVVNVGPADVVFHVIGNPAAALDALLDNAARLDPIGAVSAPSSPAAIGEFVDHVAAALRDLDAGHQVVAAPGGQGTVETDVAVIDQPQSGVTYVNGSAGEAPKLKDELPHNSPLAEPDAAATDKGGHAAQEGTGDGSPESVSVSLDTGANALVNSASVLDDMLECRVLATGGDYVTLNAIVQVNVSSDCDSIGASLAGWQDPPHGATIAFDIAAITHVALPLQGAAASDAPSIFPNFWNVTEIDGDFTLLNWVQQVNFVTDNDVVTLSCSGSSAEVSTGANRTTNAISAFDLGKHYDLILVAGDYYHANVIQQTNVLLDNDILGGVGGFQTSGEATVSTAGNLLWNQAKITIIGSDDASALPAAYATALDNFAAGLHRLPADLMHDGAFEGLAGLRVLHIKGSVHDLQYIEQTNILCDADQVALIMRSGAAEAEGDWSVSTGSNALVNTAAIIGINPSDHAYFGGDHYSDDFLVQIDVIRTDIIADPTQVDGLVSEAVVFLSDDLAGPGNGDPGASLHHVPDAHPGQSDIMQSVVS
jgi:hypothetical protein